MAQKDLSSMGNAAPEDEVEVLCANELMRVVRRLEPGEQPFARTSPTKRAANRHNALRSTGPKTQRGKARASKNATRHGLLSQDVLLPDEKREDFDGFCDGLWRSLAPVGELEGLLADRVVTSAWRLRRLLRMEAENLGEREDYRHQRLSPSVSFVSLSVNGDVLSKFSRYEAGLERGLFRALHELQRLQAARAGEVVAPPMAVDVDVSSPLSTADAP